MNRSSLRTIIDRGAGMLLIVLCGFLLTLPQGAGRAVSAALVPPPCGVPGTPACPTTTLPVPGSTMTSTSTSTSTTATPTTLPATTPSTVPPATTPAASSLPTDPPATVPPITAAQQVSSTTTEVAQQQVSAPLIVDPADSAGQPPLILATGSICSDANAPDGQAWATFLNVDAYHYPPYGPFLAYYDWVFAQGAVEVSAGSSKTSASGDSYHVLSPGQLAPGTYLFTVTDRYLGLAASAEIVVVACVPGPPPLPAPWPPVAAIPAVECADEAGYGRAWIAVHNHGGDDGSERSYSVKVTQGQSVVSATAFEGPVADDSWAVLSDYIDEGIYDVVIVDDQDPALAASVELVVPPCPGGPPPAPTDPPLVAPTITVDAPCFASPAVSSNVGLHLVNNHFDQFGGNVSTVYEVVIGDGDGGVYEFFDVDLYPGTTLYVGTGKLAPGSTSRRSPTRRSLMWPTA